MAAKRVFILGAGFSKQAGMPLANELTTLLIEKFEGVPNAQIYFSYLQDVIKWLESNTCENINFEQLFDFMRSHSELHKMRMQLIPPDHRAGRQLNLLSWLNNMEDILLDIILDKEEEARQHLKPIEQFSSHLDPDGNDVVLTFNYDTLLEKSLEQQSIKWHYGFKKEKGCGVKILKMHGSINWIMVRRDQRNGFKYDELAERMDSNVDENGVKTSNNYNVLLQIPDGDVFPTDGGISAIKVRHLQTQNRVKKIAIAGLGRYKPLSELVGSGEVWSDNAYKALHDCEHIYVIGFSFSPFDIMVRLHFGGVMMERSKKKNTKVPKITLIDHNANNLNKRIESIFGHVPTLVPKKAEEVDWNEWLS
jgi:hypothetical protein